jgi:L-iditol 2-dehydrogenase
MAENMNAVVIEAPGNYSFQKVSMPTCPDSGLLIKVLACGLCGSDLRTLRTGHHRVSLPFIVGHEICGQVKEAGSGYSGAWEIGDILAISPMVYCGRCNFCQNSQQEYCSDYKEIGQVWQGGFAEYMALPVEAVKNGAIQIVPEGMDPVHATLVEPLSSCVNAQEKGKIGLGDTVVIIGAGPIGTFHLELARARGADKIIVADIDENRLELMKSYNPDYMINSKENDLVEIVRKLTNGYGADVVITANPVPSTQVQAVEMAKKGGRILLFGGLPKDQSVPGIDMNLVHYNALHLIGTTVFAPRHNRISMQLLTSGRIAASKFVSHIFQMKDFVEGSKLALEGKARKVVFINQ